MFKLVLAAFLLVLLRIVPTFAESQLRIDTSPQTLCLATTIYYEARGEGPVGATAVAYVVLNRAASTQTSICQVVHQPGQFSFYHAHFHRHIQEPAAWTKALTIAVDAQQGVLSNPIHNATYYNTTRMPRWTQAHLLGKIGHHYFYVDRDNLNSPALVPTRSLVQFKSTRWALPATCVGQAQFRLTTAMRLTRRRRRLQPYHATHRVVSPVRVTRAPSSGCMPPTEAVHSSLMHTTPGGLVVPYRHPASDRQIRLQRVVHRSKPHSGHRHWAREAVMRRRPLKPSG